MPSENSFERMQENFDYAKSEKGMLEIAENQKAAKVMELVTRRLLESV